MNDMNNINIGLDSSINLLDINLINSFLFIVTPVIYLDNFYINLDLWFVFENSINQFQNCALISDENDKPFYTLRWEGRRLIRTWKTLYKEDIWITPTQDIECWCWRKEMWKDITNTKCWDREIWRNFSKTKHLPGMLGELNPENKLCVMRHNRFNHQNELAYWEPTTKEWSRYPEPQYVTDVEETGVKIFCKIKLGSSTWRWLYYSILDEEDKILLRWSFVLREDE